MCHIEAVGITPLNHSLHMLDTKSHYTLPGWGEGGGGGGVEDVDQEAMGLIPAPTPYWLGRCQCNVTG